MEKKSSTLALILVGVLALLFGCVLGVFLGGVGTYVLTSRIAESRQVGPQFDVTPERDWPAVPDSIVTPEIIPSSPFALVTAVTPDSPAAEAGIEVGDLITRLDGEGLGEATLADLVAEHDPGDTVIVTVRRDLRKLEIELTLGENTEAPGVPWMGITYRVVPGEIYRRFGPETERNSG